MNDTVNTDMREFWNGHGGEKWLRFHEKMDINLLPFGLETMAKASILPGEAVLDVGCGCGDTSFEIARQVGPDGHVLGLDISEPLLERAKARARQGMKSNVEFEWGDAQTTLLEKSEFDLVFSRFGVMFFDDPVAAFKNLLRPLRTGGRLAFVCWLPARENEWISKPLEVAGKHVTLPVPPGPEDPGPMSFGDPERVRRILSAAGFSNIEISRFDTPIAVGGDLDEAVAFLTQMGPASRAIEQADMDDAAKSRIETDLREALLPSSTGSGVALRSATWIVTAGKK